MFLFGLSSVIFQVLVADFEHVFTCWERYRITIAVPRILEIPYPANKYSKLTTETLNLDVKFVKSALKHVLSCLLGWVKVNKITTRSSH